MLPKNSTMWDDYVHLNEEGIKMKAKLFSNFIKNNNTIASEKNITVSTK